MSDENLKAPTAFEQLSEMLKFFSENGWWDLTNTGLACFAFYISWVAASKPIKLATFDNGYGDRIASGSNEIFKFLNQISIVLNEMEQQSRKQKAIFLMEEILEFTNPLVNASIYFDENYPKRKKEDQFSKHATEISDKIGEILEILSGNTSSSVNWKTKYDGNIAAIHDALNEITQLLLKYKKKI